MFSRYLARIARRVYFTTTRRYHLHSEKDSNFDTRYLGAIGLGLCFCASIYFGKDEIMSENHGNNLFADQTFGVSFSARPILAGLVGAPTLINVINAKESPEIFIGHNDGILNLETAEDHFQVGHSYLEKKEDPLCYANAAKHFKEAAKRGHPRAQTFLGKMYSEGLGVEKNLTKALEYYELANENGSPIAKHNLAILYLEGRGVQKDFTRAHQLLKEAATGGLSEAWFLLGHISEMGIGVDKDIRKAYQNYQKSAEKHCSKILDDIEREKKELCLLLKQSPVKIKC